MRITKPILYDPLDPTEIIYLTLDGDTVRIDLSSAIPDIFQGALYQTLERNLLESPEHTLNAHEYLVVLGTLTALDSGEGLIHKAINALKELTC